MNSQQEMRPAAVITGASDGIGRAIATYIARERGVVVLVARSPERLAATADGLTQAGAEPKMLELDLLADNAVVRLEEFLSDNRLYCDVLVNSAGFALRGAALSLPIGDQLDMINLNVRALTELTLHFLPGMVSRGSGGVINLSSVAGFFPGPHMALYYASKSFVRLFSLALYQELRGSGVTVTCVAPGPVRTNFLERAGARRAPLFRILPKADAEMVAERAWRGFKSGCRLVVPGITAKLTVLGASLVPSAVLLPLMDRLQRQTQLNNLNIL